METLQLPSLSSVYVLMTYNPLGEICLVIGVGRLHHDVQSVPHHHCTLSMAMGDDGLEDWYRTFVSEQDLLAKV